MLGSLGLLLFVEAVFSDELMKKISRNVGICPTATHFKRKGSGIIAWVKGPVLAPPSSRGVKHGKRSRSILLCWCGTYELRDSLDTSIIVVIQSMEGYIFIKPDRATLQNESPFRNWCDVLAISWGKGAEIRFSILFFDSSGRFW